MATRSKTKEHQLYSAHQLYLQPYLSARKTIFNLEKYKRIQLPEKSVMIINHHIKGRENFMGPLYIELTKKYTSSQTKKLEKLTFQFVHQSKIKKRLQRIYAGKLNDFDCCINPYSDEIQKKETVHLLIYNKELVGYEFVIYVYQHSYIGFKLKSVKYDGWITYSKEGKLEQWTENYMKKFNGVSLEGQYSISVHFKSGVQYILMHLFFVINNTKFIFR